METIVIILIVIALLFVIEVYRSDKYWKKEREKFKPSVIVLPGGIPYYFQRTEINQVSGALFFVMSEEKLNGIVFTDCDHANQMLEIVREQYKRANLEEV